MGELLNPDYWRRACHFFAASGASKWIGAYFFHDKSSSRVLIGLSVQCPIETGGNSETKNDHMQAYEGAVESDDGRFHRLKSVLNAGDPCFFLVSPDKDRRQADSRIPHIVFVRPIVELTFSPASPGGAISFAADAVADRWGKELLSKHVATELPATTPTDWPVASFPELAAGWMPVDDDTKFQQQIKAAISLLAEFPDGKMTLTRTYTKNVSCSRSPFELYILQSQENGDYACSHFFCVRNGVYSIGCTPENVFSIRDGTLQIDVVAGTCLPTDDPDILKRELTANRKQVREHLTSLYSRSGRYEKFCKQNTLFISRKMQLKKLSNVFHMHSVISGQMLQSKTTMDVLQNVFPLLSARPKELMPLYEEFDPHAHRYYGGIVGRTFEETSDCFLNIRNVLVIDGILYAKVGVGIISESDPDAELAETHHKVSGLMRAVRLWEK